MNVAFLPVAALELEDAVAYYNQQSEGLGYQFAVEVQRTWDRIAEFPDAWPALSEPSRRCRLHRFPSLRRMCWTFSIRAPRATWMRGVRGASSAPPCSSKKPI